MLDVGRGRWPAQITWNWGGGAGRVGDHVVGLQIGAKWTAGTGFTENGIIVDGRLTKLGAELEWEYDWDAPMQPWHVVDPGGQLDIVLSPRYDKFTKGAGGGTHQVFGTWSGRVTTDDGVALEFDDAVQGSPRKRAKTGEGHSRALVDGREWSRSSRRAPRPSTPPSPRRRRRPRSQRRRTSPSRMSSTAPAQTINGFGASGAWWPNDLVHFPDDVKKNVADMLFSEHGIALSGYRYNIGGGGVGVKKPARAPNQEPTDVAGRTFLAAANDAKVPILTGFVNSAPPQFTTNAQSCGGNLKPGSEAAYAQYLAGIVERLHDRDHITLQYVSPMNEPDDSFPDCGQEGMRVPVDATSACRADARRRTRAARAVRESHRRRNHRRRDPRE